MSHHRSFIPALARGVVYGVIVGAFSWGSLHAASENPAATAAAKPQLGINLAGPADWNTELPFVDVFRLSREWISQREGAPWAQGPTLALDDHGWVTALEPGCWAETLLCTIEGGHYPGGEYTVLYEGEGRLEFAGAGTVKSTEPGRVIIDVDPTRGALFLRLRETARDNPVRKIRVVMPGFADTFADEPFHPAFLKRWQGVTCFRFMDWMDTNGSKVSKWADRPQLADATFTRSGIPLEVMVDLCNRQQADAWFCMPHLADDDYIRRFAEQVKATLDPGLNIHIEYSNEVWNSMFAQTRYSQERGKALGLGPAERPWEGGGMYYARRSVEIFRIWEEVFGGTDRLVRVLAWQSGNSWWMENIILPHEDAYKHADALSIAPYMGMNIPARGDGLTAEVVASWTVDQALDHLETVALPASVKSIQRSREVAEKFGLVLTAYEGGQHMVGVGGGENNEALTRLFQDANNHPRMGAVYNRYFDAWTEAGGGLFCYFSSVSKWSKWGSWGALQYYDEDPAQSPKMSAVMKWARSLGQPVSGAPVVHKRVVAYVPNWINLNSYADKIDYSKVTHINIAFENPINDEGDLSFREHNEVLIKKARAHGVKVLVSIGGGGASENKAMRERYFALIKEDKRAAFVEKLTAYVIKHEFDGIDVDIEGPAINDDFGPLIDALGEAMKSRGKLLTAALSRGYGGRNVPDSVFAHFDFLNIMAYDATGPWAPKNPGPHASLAFAIANAEYWVNRGLPRSKAVLGVPFYGHAFGKAAGGGDHSFRGIVAKYKGAEHKDNAGDIIWYNGIPTIEAKTRYVVEEGLGGIMIWALSYDAPGDKSLLNAIHKTLHPETAQAVVSE